jgi:hypothetical protein
MSARLAILNITSFVGQCSDAEHLYGNLILSTKENVTIDNVCDWNVKYLGENIELTREITLEEAKELDIKEQSYGANRRYWLNGDKTISRFNTFKQVVDAGIEKWKDLGLEGVCPFISLYEGDKYYKNSYNSDETVIIQ